MDKMSSDVDVTQQNMQRLSGSYSFSKICAIFIVLVLLGIYRISSYKLDIFQFKTRQDMTSTKTALTKQICSGGKRPLQYEYKNGIYGIPFPNPQANIGLFKRVCANADTTVARSVMENFVFVSAASDNHFGEVWKALKVIRERDSDRSVIVYDLGLTTSYVEKLKTEKNVIYRKFNFTEYPKHMKRLKYYAWKPMIVLEVLCDYKAMIWIDSSARLLTNNYTKLFSKAQTSGGIVQMNPSRHSVFAATHPNMYKYIPSNITALKEAENYQSTLFIVNTLENCDKFLWWYFLCSLTKMCIAPTDRLACTFARTDRFAVYANCHRFDMSLLNVLLRNRFNFNSDKYTIGNGLVTIRRGDI